MAYSRFSYADLYVFMSVHGHLECCGCWLDNEWRFDSTQAMIEHIQKHRDAGHNVPPNLEVELLADDEQNFPPQCKEGHDWGEPYHPYPDNQNEFIRDLTRRKCTRCSREDH